MSNLAANTDREIWRRDPDDYYSPSIHVTETGGIGVNVGGTVIVRSVEEWHKMGLDDRELALNYLSLDTQATELLRENAALKAKVAGLEQEVQILLDQIPIRSDESENVELSCDPDDYPLF